MSVLSDAPFVPAHVNVEMLVGIASSIARLEAKFDAVDARIGSLETRMGSVEVSIAELRSKVGTIETDVRKLLDWKQRLWGMFLLISLAAAVAPSAWRSVAGVLPAGLSNGNPAATD